MHTLLLLALLQAPPDSLIFETIYQKPFNDTLLLSVAVAKQNNFTDLRVHLVDRRSPKYPTVLAGVRDQGLDSYKVLRSDDSSLVIARVGYYQSMQRLKLFLDPRTKRVVKQIDYPPNVGFRAIDEREIASALELPASVAPQLLTKPWDIHPLTADSSYLRPEFRAHPMPRSTFAEFARARPEMIENGFEEQHTTLDERPGPYQVIGSRIWLGKAFYDGEGITGVGGFGYFDISTSQYHFLSVQGLADWSVSAILVEEDAAWIGLLGYPEGEEYGGGLIRYDFKSRTSRKFPTEEVIGRIIRWKDRIYLQTTNGGYQIRGNAVVRRYRVEPNIDHRFIIVTEDPARAP
jgi:hypothetical protein